jgi:ubiquinone/menaquinone biosynthesis C-methylase UbiE
MQSQDELEWTGERFLPYIGGRIALEHYHRYMFAADFVRNKSVLDIACGEGYGSRMLSLEAKNVTGVDIDSETIKHAISKYSSERVAFKSGSCLNIPAEKLFFDVVVSFETLEHLAEHDQMMLEIKRVLRADGVLIISSPNKLVYSDAANYANEHHVKELYKDDFLSLLKQYFKHVKILGQRVIFGSAMMSENRADQFLYIKNINNLDEQSNSQEILNDPMYWIAICSDQPILGAYSSILDQDLDAIDLAVSNKWLTEENTKLHNTINQTCDRLVKSQNDIQALEHTVKMMAESLSWKATYPLRLLDKYIRGAAK